MDLDVKVIGILVAGRIVAHLFAVLPLPLDLGPALVDVQVTAGDVGKGQHIRVGLGQIPGGSHHEGPGVLVQQDFGLLTQGTGGTEGRHLLLVGFPVFQLLLNLLHGGVPAVVKPRGELGRAGLAHVAVLQLSVA